MAVLLTFFTFNFVQKSLSKEWHLQIDVMWAEWQYLNKHAPLILVYIHSWKKSILYCLGQ